MKCPPRRLFWLLFWLGLVLMLLDALSFCVSLGILERSRKSRELATIKDLQVAIKGFEAEYGRYPMAKAGSSQDDLTIDSANGRFLGSLLGDDLQDNPRNIAFVELPLAKAGRGGLVGEKGSFRLLDQWGHPYQVIMDVNLDGKVANPDLRSADTKIRSEAAEWLPLGLAVFGCGIDGVPNTADDITSWRDSPPSAHPVATTPYIMTIIGMVLSTVGLAGVLLSKRQSKQPADAN